MSAPGLGIVGAGPAGMAAAIEAARAGVTVHVWDENPRPGGQIYRQPLAPLRAASNGARDAERGRRLLAELEAQASRVVLHSGALVWGVFDERTLTIAKPNGSVSVRPETLVLAQGAYDRPVPLPGWTLPGVYTAGACQLLVKSQGVLPGKRILVAGTGPLLAVVAGQLARAGATVVGVLEASSLAGGWRAAPWVWGQWELLGDAWHHWSELRRAGIPFHRARTVASILGDAEVRGAITVALDDEWRPLPGTESRVDVDTVCLGFGFLPSTELAQLAGCEHRWVRERGGWVPARSAEMETTVPGVYAAGDGAGIGGSMVAVLEGRIAGIAAARRLGALSPGEAAQRLAPHQKALAPLMRLRAVIDDLTCVRDGLAELITPDTIVCRCEEVTAREILEVIDEGAQDVAEVKRLTRAGMGPCQGRMCASAVATLLARRRGRSPAAAGAPSVRPPVKPVPIEMLAMLSEE